MHICLIFTATYEDISLKSRLTLKQEYLHFQGETHFRSLKLSKKGLLLYCCINFDKINENTHLRGNLELYIYMNNYTLLRQQQHHHHFKINY